MNVLMMTTNASLLDGINRHILTIAIALNNLPHFKIAVCTTHSRGELHNELEANGVITYSLNARNGHKFSILWRYVRILKDFKPDIVHLHVMPIMANIVLKYLYPSVKRISTIHGIGIDLNPQKKTLKDLPKRFVLFLIDCFIKLRINHTCYISYGVRDVYRKFGYNTEHSSVIYNPKPLLLASKKARLYDLLNLNPSCKIIGTACRIAMIKQPMLFTEVMCAILKKNKNIHAVILGDGDTHLIKKIDDYVRQNNVKERFHMLGYRQDAVTLLADMDCFILTSMQEGMPTAILEAMTQKTLVAFMKGGGGLIDLAAMNNDARPFAITSSMGDVTEMSTKILECLENQILYAQYIKNAEKLLLDRFKTSTIIKQLEYVYFQVK